MREKLRVAVVMVQSHWARQVAERLAALQDVRLVPTTPDGVLTAEAAPHVIVVDDAPDVADVFERVARLRQMAAQAQVVVVSADARPEHVVALMKAGVHEYVAAPIEADKLEQAIERLHDALARSAPAHRGSVVSFVSSKGGVGSTVLSVNTAVTLGLRRSGEVALVDNALASGDASVLLDVVAKTTMADVARNFHRLDSAFLKAAILRHPLGIDYLAAPTQPEEAGVVRGEHIRRVLEIAVSLYRHVIVDCGSFSVGRWLTEAFAVSEKSFGVTDLSVPAVRNAARLVQMIQKGGVSGRRIEVVVNRHIKGGIPPIAEIERTLGRRVFWLFPNDFKDVVTSINRGIPLAKSHPSSALGKSVKQFADRLAEPAKADPEYRGLRGFLGRAV